MYTGEGAGMITYRWCYCLGKNSRLHQGNDDNHQLARFTLPLVYMCHSGTGLHKEVLLQKSYGFLPVISIKNRQM
jgi:hypothetical protein